MIKEVTLRHMERTTTKGEDGSYQAFEGEASITWSIQGTEDELEVSHGELAEGMKVKMLNEVKHLATRAQKSGPEWLNEKKEEPK